MPNTTAFEITVVVITSAIDKLQKDGRSLLSYTPKTPGSNLRWLGNVNITIFQKTWIQADMNANEAPVLTFSQTYAAALFSHNTHLPAS